MTHDTLRQVLHTIPADQVSGYDWIRIGMALKLEGLDLADWDDWSATDTRRYHPGECARMWQDFKRDSGITGGTIVWIAKQIAKEEGRTLITSTPKSVTYTDAASYLASFQPIPKDPIDKMLSAPRKDPSDQLLEYITTLFQPGDTIGYVTNARQNEDGKWLPSSAKYISYEDATRRLEEGEEVETVLGHYTHDAGAWICANPLYYGAKAQNVEDFRWTLIECDTISPKEQIKKYLALQLPIATLTYSGGKSVHAIVHIDASSAEEYAKRVAFMYAYVRGCGLQLDEANKNPNRWSRLPGVHRGQQEQWLIATDLGADDYADWVRTISGLEV